MKDFNLYWADAHTQFHTLKDSQFAGGRFPYGNNWEGFVRQSLEFARGHLDVYAPIYYPAYAYTMKEGLGNESLGMKEGFQEEWEIIQKLTAQYNRPGELVTFPGYEWTGGRRVWGDHNVVYFEEGKPLELSLDIKDIFRAVRKHRGIAIPHHTGYRVANRGKDWSRHDPALSPVAEIYSVHGSSEGIDAPYDMSRNGYMSPRVSGGTIQDGLSKGCRFGFIASGDNGGGFPGRWGWGLAGIWAKGLTRDHIWDALMARRTYAVTGDRIKLEFYADGHFMGEELESKQKVEFSGTVEASGAIDRIELLRNGEVIDTLCHNGKWSLPENGPLRMKLRLEVGWGPTRARGLEFGNKMWKGNISVENARILGHEGCFTRGPQKVTQEETCCAWELVTARRTRPAEGECQQAIVVEMEGDLESKAHIRNDSLEYEASFRDLLTGSVVLRDIATSRKMVRDQFNLEQFENCENLFSHLAYKLLIHRAAPQSAYSLPFSFSDTPPSGRNHYYVRVSQTNGQMAWSSPVWVEA